MIWCILIYMYILCYDDHLHNEWWPNVTDVLWVGSIGVSFRKTITESTEHVDLKHYDITRHVVSVPGKYVPRAICVISLALYKPNLSCTRTHTYKQTDTHTHTCVKRHSDNFRYNKCTYVYRIGCIFILSCIWV